MALQTLSIDLVAQLARFSADMRKAASVSEQAGRQIANGLGIAKSALAGLAAGVTFGGLISLAKTAIDSIDRLNDLKDATGASIEKLSGLEDVAARTGTSFDTVGDSLLKFNTALKDAKPGSDAEAAFKSLGLSVAELKRLDPAEALRQTAIAMAGFADDGNKARLSQELFGKSLREVAPFLKNLAEAGELVTKVTAEQAQEAENFNRELLAIQKNAQDLARVLASDFVTAINRAAAAMREGGFIEGLKTLFGGDASHRQNVRLSELTNDLLEAEAKLSKFKGSDNFFARGLAAGAQKEVDGIRKAIAEIQRLRDIGNPDNQSAAESARLFGKGRPSVQFNGAIKPVKLPALTRGGKTGDDITDAQRELARYVDQLQGAIEKTQELSEQEKALNFLRQLGTTGQIPQVRELVLGMAEQIDATKQLRAEQEALLEVDKAVAAQARAAAEARQGRLDSLLGATATAQLDKSREDILLLTEEFQRFIDTAGQAGISEQLYLEAVSARLDLTATKIEKSKTLAEELGLSFTSAFEDAIVGGKSFSDVLKGLEQDMIRIVTRKLVTEPLGNAISGIFSGGGSGGGGLGGIFGKVFSSIFGSFDGGGYTGNGPRAGGMDGKGGYLAMLHPRETVVDHTKGQRTGRSVVVTINQSFAQGTSRATTMQAAADARRQLEYAGRNL